MHKPSVSLARALTSFLVLAASVASQAAFAQSDAYHKGYDFFKNEQYTACAEEMAKAVAEAPDDYDRLYLHAVCLSKADQWNAAIEPLKKATMIKDDSPDAFRLLSHAYLKAPKPDFYQAKVSLERVVKLEPKDFQSTYLLGATSLKLNDLDAAIGAFKKAVEMKPSDFTANRDLGLAYLKARDYEQAEKALGTAVNTKPTDCQLVEYLGTAQINNKADDNYAAEALKTVRSCADKPNVSANMAFIAGRAALFTNDADLAAKYLATAANKDGSNYSALNYYGQALEIQKKNAEALTAYNKALDLAKKAGVKGTELSDYYYRVAHSLHLTGKYDESLPLYDETLKLNPGHERAKHWRTKAMERIEQRKLQE